MLSKSKFMEIVGNNIRNIRKKKNLTLDDLSGESGFSRTYINLIENARITPSSYNLYRIAKALNATVDDLYPSTV